MSRIQEVVDEFKSVIAGQIPLVDVVFPPIIFTVLKGFLPLNAALIVSLIFSSTLLLYRWLRQESFAYASSGVVVILLAAGLSWLTQSAAGYYLPGVITSGLTALLCLISLLFQKPFAAWSSHLTRNWPLSWYWHDRVRPAYAEVTIGWLVFFAAQFAVQVYFFRQGKSQSLGWVQIVTGWPALILILAASYLYGLNRLNSLQGPSVQEFEEDIPPPWEGQQRGF